MMMMMIKIMMLMMHCFCDLQENDYLQECLEVVQQEFMIFNREK